MSEGLKMLANARVEAAKITAGKRRRMQTITEVYLKRSWRKWTEIYKRRNLQEFQLMSSEMAARRDQITNVMWEDY
jgi:hypothetical protein